MKLSRWLLAVPFLISGAFYTLFPLSSSESSSSLQPVPRNIQPAQLPPSPVLRREKLSQPSVLEGRLEGSASARFFVSPELSARIERTFYSFVFPQRPSLDDVADVLLQLIDKGKISEELALLNIDHASQPVELPPFVFSCGALDYALVCSRSSCSSSDGLQDPLYNLSLTTPRNLLFEGYAHLTGFSLNMMRSRTPPSFFVSARPHDLSVERRFTPEELPSFLGYFEAIKNQPLFYNVGWVQCRPPEDLPLYLSPLFLAYDTEVVGESEVYTLKLVNKEDLPDERGKTILDESTTFFDTSGPHLNALLDLLYR